MGGAHGEATAQGEKQPKPAIETPEISPLGQGTLPLFFAGEAERDSWTKAMRGTSTLSIWPLQPEKQANGEERSRRI